MPESEGLKRLGGGRWETRDGRFTIEPQSGTWAVVDNTQTNELGLPLVRGPYKSLTAAKEAIETSREGGPTESPLAGRLKEAAKRPAKAGAKAKGTASHGREGPEPPLEPKWITDLEPAERREARALIERLERAGVSDPEAIARAEIVRNQPAVARVAIERRLAKAAATKDPADVVKRAIDAILIGRDGDLGVRWRLVDDDGRRIDELDVEG